MANALSRHDFAYRLGTILEDAGIAQPPGLLARKARLRDLAETARTAPLAP
jgi:hypothetical protein